MWTPAQIEARLAEACTTLRRVPGGHIWPSEIRIGWPDIVREFSEAYGYNAAQRPRVQATAEDIRRMDEALGWASKWLNAEAASRAGLVEDSVKVVMWRATGRRWDQIGVWRAEIWGKRPTQGGGRSAIPGGNSYPSLRRIHDMALAHVAAQLNGTRAPEIFPGEYDQGPRLEEQVVVEFPVDERGTYGPVHARARWTIAPKKGRN